jgi:small-conductance mechanosensitive channel
MTPWSKAALIAAGGLALGMALGQLVSRLPLADGVEAPVKRLVATVVTGAFVAAALQTLGFDLSIVLGAAGFATVAIGFAAQTSASNVISGLFLIGERPFAVGDTVTIANTTGIVLSIDLLSVKLRTYDNVFVRVPNETAMKAEIRNLSRFPVRRVDLVVRISHDADLAAAHALLLRLADDEPFALDEPRPQVFFQGYGESGAELQLSAWATREEFFKLKTALAIRVPQALRAAGFEAAVPTRRLLST